MRTGPRSGLERERRASMIVARSRSESPGRTGAGQRSSSTPGEARLAAGDTGLACLIMLERVSFLINAGVNLPRPEMTDRLTAIILAAFCSAS